MPAIKEIYKPGEMRKTKKASFFDSQEQAQAFIDVNGGQIYTGIHKPNDWSQTAWWEKGWHLVNRTGEYAVLPIPSIFEHEITFTDTL